MPKPKKGGCPRYKYEQRRENVWSWTVLLSCYLIQKFKVVKLNWRRSTPKKVAMRLGPRNPDDITESTPSKILIILFETRLRKNIIWNEAPLKKMILFATRLCKKVWSCRAGKSVTSMQIRIIYPLALCKCEQNCKSIFVSLNPSISWDCISPQILQMSCDRRISWFCCPDTGQLDMLRVFFPFIWLNIINRP